MKEYRVTEESMEAAKREYRNHFGKAATGNGFIAALDALFVPVEAEGWVELDRNNSELGYKKGEYQLWWFKHLGVWLLYKDGNSPAIQQYSAFQKQTLEAQAWADRVIAEREALVASRPKPLGPGTRLRAPNGDEVVVIGNCLEQDGMVVNLRTNRATTLPDSCYWHSFAYLQNYLESAGYEIIE